MKIFLALSFFVVCHDSAWLNTESTIVALTAPCLAGVSATMSSPTSTPGSRKRGRNATPGTREFTCLVRVVNWCGVSSSGLTCAMCVCVCMWCQRAARAPYLLRLSDAGARTPRLAIWCRCPPPLPQMAWVQLPLRTPHCSPALVPQVSTTQHAPAWGFRQNYSRLWQCLNYFIFLSFF